MTTDFAKVRNQFMKLKGKQFEEVAGGDAEDLVEDYPDFNMAEAKALKIMCDAKAMPEGYSKLVVIDSPTLLDHKYTFTVDEAMLLVTALVDKLIPILECGDHPCTCDVGVGHEIAALDDAYSAGSRYEE